MSRLLMAQTSLFNFKSKLWELERIYEDDYKVVIKERESWRIPLGRTSPQLEYRKQLMQYLKNLATVKQLTHCTVHLAVYLLDIFMDNHSIKTDRLLLVANACLLLAAKMEENSANIPKISELNAQVNNRYTRELYKTVELIILKFFDWNIMYPTAAHYIHYYMQVIVGAKDPQGPYTARLQNLISKLYLFIRIYLDKIIDDIQFAHNYPPSKLAAAIIAIAREKAGLSMWNEELEKMTEYTEDQLRDVCNILI